MKKITLILFLLTYTLGFSQNAPLTFESGEYGSTWSFNNFENGTVSSVGYEKVANPNASGINTSATVGKFTAVSTGAPQAGCQSNGIGMFTLDTNNSTVKMMVYKSVISDIALKFAKGDGASLGEIKAKNTKINEWEELTFDFNGQIGKLESTDIVTMIFSLDYQARSADNICYFDNVTFSKSTVVTPKIPCDAVFKDAQQGTFDLGYKAKFETVGTDVFITFELLDQKDGTVAYLWKESPFGETAMANQSGRIFTYTLTGQTAGSILSYACKFGFAGGLAVTKYFKYTVGDSCGSEPISTGTTPVLPLDFESSTIAYSFIDFDGGIATKITNPHIVGSNTSATVAKMVKGAGADWAGSKIVMASAVDFSAKKLFKVKVWSPVAGKKLLLKFEGVGAAFAKESAGVTTANAWEELSFDFTGVAGLNNLNDTMVFIFDLGTAGDGSANSTYLFDDVVQSVVSGGGTTNTVPTLPLDFESSTTAYSFIDFDGGAVTKIANPHIAGSNTSATVAKMIKGAGADWAGSKIVMASAVDFTTNKLFKVKVWSPVAGKKLLLKFEGAGAAFEKESAGVTTANAWEELSFDFTGVIGLNNLNDTMVFIFDLGTAGDGSANSTYLFDDIVQSAVSGGGTTAGPYAPVTFESGEYGSTWSFNNFENGTVSSVGYEKVANPNVSGINTSATVGKFTAVVAGAPYAGCQSNGIGKFTLDANNSVVKMMVYKSVISDVALKFATADGGSLGEIKAKNTKINEWEELTFDFYGQIGKFESTDIVTIIFSLDYQARSADNISYFDNVTFSKSTVVTPKIPCDAVFKDAQQGTFDVGYKAKFETVGTDVFITFELLDQKDGTVAYLWKESPFGETAMANQSGRIFTYKLTGQTAGSILSYACKFGFAGGLAVTKYFKYTVGDSCGQAVIGALNVPAKTVGDAAFDLVDPTSASPGTFTFTSGNTAVATISGRTVTIVGAGTSVITATQAASGSYPTDSVSANLVVTSGSTATVPTVAAPTPPSRNAADVISIYGDSYTNITGVITNPNWSQNTVVTEVSIAGNPTLKYANFNYQGTDWSANAQNISAMEFLHVDVWTNAEAPNLHVLSCDCNKANPISSTPGSWHSMDIPVSNFTTANLAAVNQFKFDGGNGGTIYIDNMYFYKGTSLGTTKFETSNVKMYPNPIKNNLTIDANGTIGKISIYNILGQEVLTTFPKANSATLQTNTLQKGVYIVKTEIDGKVSASKIIKE